MIKVMKLLLVLTTILLTACSMDISGEMISANAERVETQPETQPAIQAETQSSIQTDRIPLPWPWVIKHLQ